MNLLVIGSGGREHALCWALSASPLVTKLVCAPGNPGIGQVARLAPVNPTDLDAVLQLCRDEHIDFVVVGPEAPLVAGLVDHLEAAGFACFGPTKSAARLEGSKGFMKDLCAKYGIPTAAYGRFRDAASAEAFILADHQSALAEIALPGQAGWRVIGANRSRQHTGEGQQAGGKPTLHPRRTGSRSRPWRATAASA